jgi:hypothetical protein
MELFDNFDYLSNFRSDLSTISVTMIILQAIIRSFALKKPSFISDPSTKMVTLYYTVLFKMHFHIFPHHQAKINRKIVISAVL